MRHLNTETLARLVDEPAGPEETKHLASCEACARELEALREQRDALASLPDLRPPAGDWRDLRERLVQEGLVRADSGPRGTDGASRDAGPPPGSGPAALLARSGWLQAAAALILFLGGAGVGVAGARTLGPGAGGSPSDAAGLPSVSQASDPAEAADLLQDAEDRYVSALIRYRELAGEDANGAQDPASRYAALEALVAASQAAVRRAPTDPFINGVLANTLAERQATLRQISTSSADNWF